jgi:apolipoprotein N-acyltransferase
MIVLTIAYGAFSLTRSCPRERPISLALIQPSFDQNDKEKNVSEGVMLRKHLEMTDRAVAEKHPDIVVWPESVTFLNWLVGPPNRDAWLTRVMLYNATLVTGVYNWDDPKHSYNSVAAFDPERGYLGEYRKIQIVPFGEAVPYRSAVERISPRAGRWLRRNVYEYDTAAGRKYKIFDSREGRFGAMICFESVFPQYAREFTRHGAEFLFVITNDAWFYDTPGTYQHAAMASLRAIENRRFVVQAANSGISGFYDPYGRPVSETKIFDETTLFGTIYPRHGLTPYARFGDIIVWLCIAFAAPALAVLAATREKSASRQQPAPPKKASPPPSTKNKSKNKKRKKPKKKK